MKLLEEYVQSKNGEEEQHHQQLKEQDSCEDCLILTKDYACVVDGATSPSGRRWTEANIKAGQWAARLLVAGVANLPPKCSSAREIVDLLTQSIHDAYQSENVLEVMARNPVERATASLGLYSNYLRQLIFVGDCQALLVGGEGKIAKAIQYEKFNDTVMSQARSMLWHIELAKKTSGGYTNSPIEVTEQNEVDVGREFIRPLLSGQRWFQNNPHAHPRFQYWVLDGFPVSEQGIKIHDIDHSIQEIILASDGYPTLHPTLKKTEKELFDLLQKDPLLIDFYMSTKGVAKGSESFDDRTYLRFQLDVPLSK